MINPSRSKRPRRELKGPWPIPFVCRLCRREATDAGGRYGKRQWICPPCVSARLLQDAPDGDPLCNRSVDAHSLEDVLNRRRGFTTAGECVARIMGALQADAARRCAS